MVLPVKRTSLMLQSRTFEIPLMNSEVLMTKPQQHTVPMMDCKLLTINSELEYRILKI